MTKFAAVMNQLSSKLTLTRLEILLPPLYAVLFVWLCFALPVGISPYPNFFLSTARIAIGVVEGLFPAVFLLMLCRLPLLCGSGLPARSFYYCSTALVVFLSWGFCCFELLVGASAMCRLNDAVLSLILQTDRSEASGFIRHTLLQPLVHQAIFLSVLPALIAALTFACRKLLRRARRVVLRLSIPALAVSFGVFVWANFISGTNLSDARQTFRLSPFQLHLAYAGIEDKGRLVRDIVQANDDANPQCGPGGLPTIVVIIGESANKHRSSLYGYRLPTDSAVSSLSALGRLVVFNDAVTGDCTTNLVMKQLLSSAGDSQWHKRPLLPAVLRKAGYNVGYFDNQGVRSTVETEDYSSIFFLNDTTVERQSFDVRNTERLSLDGDFIDEYADEIFSLPEPCVAFIHLAGQHFPAVEHYPAGEGRFTKDDYIGYTDDAREAEDIMHYDNATFYVSNVVADLASRFRDRDAVVIYLPDHGEEVYDYRQRYGRTVEPVTPERAKALYEIPMWVFMTRAFEAGHPEIASALESNSAKPVFTYDLPALVLDMAGVGGAFAPRQRSIASKSYDASGRRLIDKGSCDYDSLMIVSRKKSLSLQG